MGQLLSGYASAMSEITIRLRYNLNSGKKDILIDYHSDEDALPIEHEDDHRTVVEQLLGRGVLRQDEVGEVVVRRLTPDTTPPLSQPPMPTQEATAEEA